MNSFDGDAARGAGGNRPSRGRTAFPGRLRRIAGMGPAAIGFLLAAATIFAGGSGAAGDSGDPGGPRAAIPYRIAHELMLAGRSSIPPAGFEWALRVESTRKKRVLPSSIHLSIESESGRIPLRIDSNGFFRLPLREDLLKENPPIVSNQPRGTLRLRPAILLSGWENERKREIRYRDLMAPIHWAQGAKEELARRKGGEIPAAVFRGMRLHPGRGVPGGATVVRAEGGEIRVEPDAGDGFLVPWDEAYWEENPTVLLPPTDAVGLEVVFGRKK